MSSSRNPDLNLLNHYSGDFIPLSISGPIVNDLARQLFGRDLRLIAQQSITSELVGYSVEYARTASSSILSKYNQTSVLRSYIDDVGQDVGITVFQRFQSFEGGSTYTTWLHRCAINQALAYIRKSRGMSMHLEPEAKDLVLNQKRDREPSPAEIVETRDMWAAFHRARAKLSENHKTILELDEQELSYQEIAFELSIPINTVRSRLNRARKSLALIIEKELSFAWFSEVLKSAMK